MELSWENQLTNGEPVENSSIKLWTPDNDSGIPLQGKAMKKIMMIFTKITRTFKRHVTYRQANQSDIILVKFIRYFLFIRTTEGVHFQVHNHGPNGRHELICRHSQQDGPEWVGNLCRMEATLLITSEFY
jgi:hypothetical protein